MTLNKTVEWFEQAVPTPSAKAMDVQAGCHFEEVVKLLDTLILEGDSCKSYDMAKHHLTRLADQLKSGERRIKEILTSWAILTH